MRFKIYLLLIISAASAVSIEFPSLGFSHPNTYPIHHEDLTSPSTSSSTLADAYSKMPVTKSGDLSELGLGNTSPFADIPRSDRIEFPSFALSHSDTNAVLGLSHPNTNPVDPRPQDLTGHSTPSLSLSEFYLNKPHQ